jgi:hypothetical protein
MESIENFFRTTIDRLSYQIRYKITDIADSKINKIVERPFNQRVSNSQQTTTRHERNTN